MARIDTPLTDAAGTPESPSFWKRTKEKLFGHPFASAAIAASAADKAQRTADFFRAGIERVSSWRRPSDAETLVPEEAAAAVAGDTPPETPAEVVLPVPEEPTPILDVATDRIVLVNMYGVQERARQLAAQKEEVPVKEKKGGVAGAMQSTRGFFGNVWNNFTRSPREFINAHKLEQAIYKTGSFYVMEEDGDSMMKRDRRAILDRFAANTEETLNTHGDKEGICKEVVPEFQEQIRILLAAYAAAEPLMTDEDFHQKREEIYFAHGYLLEDSITVDNLLEVAQSLRARPDGVAVAETLEITAGYARHGVYTASRATNFDKAARAMARVPVLNKIALPVVATAVAASVGFLAGVRSLLRSTASQYVLLGGGMVASAAMYGADAANKMNRDLIAHRQAIAEGRQFASSDRRNKFSKFLPEMRPAQELILRGEEVPAGSPEALVLLAEIEARLEFAAVKNIDSISYTSREKLETERRSLMIARIKLRHGLTEADKGALKVRTAELLGQLTSNLDTTTKAYKDWRNGEAVKQGLTSAAIGTAFGLISAWGLDRIKDLLHLDPVDIKTPVRKEGATPSVAETPPAAPITVTRDVPVEEYMNTNKEVKTIAQVTWLDNGTPRADGNEKQLKWFKGNGIYEDGRVALDLRGMTEISTYKGHPYNVQDLIEKGQVKIAMSASVGTQTKIFLFDVDADGIPKIDITTEPGKSLFARVKENGVEKTVFRGFRLQAVMVDGYDEKGQARLLSLATHLGTKAMESFTVTEMSTEATAGSQKGIWISPAPEETAAPVQEVIKPAPKVSSTPDLGTVFVPVPFAPYKNLEKSDEGCQVETSTSTGDSVLPVAPPESETWMDAGDALPIDVDEFTPHGSLEDIEGIADIRAEIEKGEEKFSTMSYSACSAYLRELVRVYEIAEPRASDGEVLLTMEDYALVGTIAEEITALEMYMQEEREHVVQRILMDVPPIPPRLTLEDATDEELAQVKPQIEKWLSAALAVTLKYRLSNPGPSPLEHTLTEIDGANKAIDKIIRQRQALQASQPHFNNLVQSAQNKLNEYASVSPQNRELYKVQLEAKLLEVQKFLEDHKDLTSAAKAELIRLKAGLQVMVDTTKSFITAPIRPPVYGSLDNEDTVLEKQRQELFQGLNTLFLDKTLEELVSYYSPMNDDQLLAQIGNAKAILIAAGSLTVELTVQEEILLEEGKVRASDLVKFLTFLLEKRHHSGSLITQEDPEIEEEAIEEVSALTEDEINLAKLKEEYEAMKLKYGSAPVPSQKGKINRKKASIEALQKRIDRSKK